MRKLREQERIRSGKELQAAERENKMNELKRNVEYRKREKEQDAIARAKIKARLGGSALWRAHRWEAWTRAICCPAAQGRHEMCHRQ